MIYRTRYYENADGQFSFPGYDNTLETVKELFADEVTPSLENDSTIKLEVSAHARVYFSKRSLFPKKLRPLQGMRILSN